MLEAIRAAVRSAGGWISFARYMELALHAPGGYYAGGARKFGAEGDFVTAPEMGRLFARTLARQLREVLEPGDAILELGAGSGALAAQLLAELECDYAILETSAALRERQRERLGDRVRWVDRLPERLRGVVIANEVVDAMPVHALAWREAGVFERGVALGGDSPQWAERPASGALLAQARAIDVPRPYESEIGLAGQAWMRTLGDALARVTYLPARQLGLAAGTLAPDRAADICIFDPNHYWTLDKNTLVSRGHNTPFAGWEFKGRVAYTLLGGKLVYERKN